MFPSPERRAYLLTKRGTLRAEQEQRIATKRRDDEIGQFIDRYGGKLNDAGVQYEMVWSEQTQVLKTYVLYPIGFASVHWELVPHARRRFVELNHYLRREFDDAVSELGLSPDTKVVVDWCVGGLPRIRLRLADVSEHAVHLLHSEAWVYDPDGIWLIERYHEGDLTYAERPGRPEHAGDGWRPDRRPSLRGLLR